MCSSLVPGFYLVDYDWNQPLINVEHKNRPAIEVLEEDQGIEGTPLELFLRIPDASPRSDYQFRAIEAICPHIDIQRLHDSYEPIVWLDDRSRDRKPRKQIGFLTSQALYEALSAKRLVGYDNVTSDQPSADRRILYIPDPDHQSLPVIILTASLDQAKAFSECLYRYITADWLISVDFSEDGRYFCLEFHIPFYIWKQGRALLRDRRQRSDGSPLRESKTLSFLAGHDENTEETDCLYESQWSVMVTGYNKDVWTGYGLTDTYLYDVEDVHDRSTIQHYKRLSEEEGGISYDPICGRDSAFPLQDPREYFLQCLRTCIIRIKEEWANIDSRLERSMDRYIKHKDIFLNQDPSLHVAPDDRKSLQESKVWTKEISRLLTNFTNRIKSTGAAWECFLARGIRYFDGNYEAGCSRDRSRQHLNSIDLSFAELRRLQVHLESLKRKNDDFTKSLEMHLQVENNRTIVLQQLNVNIILIVTPPALAASMMQVGVLPWNSGFAPWAAATIVLWGLMYAFRPALNWYNRRKGDKMQPHLIFRVPREATVEGFGCQPDVPRFPPVVFERRHRHGLQRRPRDFLGKARKKKIVQKTMRYDDMTIRQDELR